MNDAASDAGELGSTPADHPEVNGVGLEQAGGFGLVAFGKSDGWEISVEESLREEGVWFVQVEGQQFTIRFQLSGLEVIFKAIQFLGSNNGQDLVLGRFEDYPVRLIWDNEFADRCFFVVESMCASSMHVTLIHKQITALQTALGQVAADLP